MLGCLIGVGESSAGGKSDIIGGGVDGEEVSCGIESGNAPGEDDVAYLARRTSIGVSDRHGAGDLAGVPWGVIL